MTPEAGLQGAPDWSAIKGRFLAGVGPRELSNLYGASVSAISTRANREGWKRERHQVMRKASESLVDAVARIVVLAAEEVVRDEVDLWQLFLERARILLEAAHNCKDLMNLAEVLAVGIEHRRRALGMTVIPPPGQGGSADGISLAALDAAGLARLYREACRPPGEGESTPAGP